MGLFVELGPLQIIKNESRYSAILREYTWNRNYNLLFFDNPVGTGYSFVENPAGYVTSEEQVADGLYSALQQFFTLFPNLRPNAFYATGESYAGKYVPALGHKLHQKRAGSHINFQGVAIGDGLTDPITQYNYGDFLYQIGLIDDRQHEHFTAVESKVKALIQQGKYLQAFETWDGTLGGFHHSGSYFGNCTGLDFYYNFLMTHEPEDFNYYTTYVTAADVRMAIHVGNATFNDGTQVAQHLTADIMQSTKPWLIELMEANYKVLLYSGQLDIIVAAPLTDQMITELEWSGAEEFAQAERRIWKVDPADDEVAGYVKRARNFFHAIVRRAGHILPYDQPRSAFDLITRFIDGRDY